MREWYVLELLHGGQDEVVLDGDEVVVTEQNYPLLLQVPVIHPEREGREWRERRREEREEKRGGREEERKERRREGGQEKRSEEEEKRGGRRQRRGRIEYITIHLQNHKVFPKNLVCILLKWISMCVYICVYQEIL